MLLLILEVCRGRGNRRIDLRQYHLLCGAVRVDDGLPCCTTSLDLELARAAVEDGLEIVGGGLVRHLCGCNRMWIRVKSVRSVLDYVIQRTGFLLLDFSRNILCFPTKS